MGQSLIALADVREADSENYGREFYGILNKDGQFWTVLAFDSEKKALQHLADFWPNETPEWCCRNFTVIPVRIRLTALSQGADHVG